jgi:carboxylesterase
MLPGLDKRVGCFIIHGFSGGPFEVKPLADYLEQYGYITCCPTLAGHDSGSGKLSRSTCLDWIHSAEEAFTEFASRCDMIIIIGFSMGGLIGVYLADKFGVDALVTISTPVYCLDYKQFAINWREIIRLRDREKLQRYIDGMGRLSLRAVLNFRKLVYLLKSKVQDIRCPLLVIQGKKDDTVKWISAYYIYDNAGTREKEIQLFPKSGHVICLDCERQLVCIRIHQFINKVVGNRLLLQNQL